MLAMRIINAADDDDYDDDDDGDDADGHQRRCWLTCQSHFYSKHSFLHVDTEAHCSGHQYYTC